MVSPVSSGFSLAYKGDAVNSAMMMYVFLSIFTLVPPGIIHDIFNLFLLFIEFIYDF